MKQPYSTWGQSEDFNVTRSSADMTGQSWMLRHQDLHSYLFPATPRPEGTSVYGKDSTTHVQPKKYSWDQSVQSIG